MTEAEWVGCTDPQKILEFLRGKVSDRKLRLFAVESVRLVSELLVHPNSRAAVEAGERVAEGVSNPDILPPIYRAAWEVLPLEPYSDVHVTAARAAGRTVQGQAYEAAVLTKNEIVELHAEMEEEKVTSEDEKNRVYWLGKAQGETLLVAFLRDIVGNPFHPVTIAPAWLTWNDATVVKLAQSTYEERAFDRMPFLADALVDSGCGDGHILANCRQSGTHVPGCWLLDLLTGR